MIMFRNERYDEIANELPLRSGEGVEVLIVLRHPDGSTTHAAVAHDAGVQFETATEYEDLLEQWGIRVTHTSHSVLQFRVTARTATVYASEYFQGGSAQTAPDHKQIEG